MKWANTDKVTYDVTIPYIRYVAGPADYTQGATRNATQKDFQISYSHPMSQGTRCRQLAEYVIFDAPLAMLCDSPTNYMREQECVDFIVSVPTVWDDTKGIDGEISKYVVMARRSETSWFVGAMTNWDARDLEIDLGFLKSGTYDLVIFRDGINAKRDATDYKKETVRLKIDKNNYLYKAHLAPGGGWVAKIVPVG